MDFIIEVQDEGVKALLERLAGKAADMSPIMVDVAGTMMESVNRNFEEEGRPKWPSLSSKYARRLEKQGKTGGMLNRTAGGLKSSIMPHHGPDFAQVGTNKKYARIHQLGGQAGRGRKVTIPARPFLRLADQDMADIRADLLDWLTRD